MEILETVPIYATPTWPLYFLLGSLICCIIAYNLQDTDYALIIATSIAALMLIAGIVLPIVLRNSEFKHDEYIVRITDISAQEFAERYEVTKRFEYSDAIQIKEINE